MQIQLRAAAGVLLGIGLVCGAGVPVCGQSPATKAAAKDKGVTTRITGEFTVKLSPLPLEDKTEGTMLARMSIFKTYRGDLEAKARGEMLSAGTKVSGSAGYVAIELVTGTLKGKQGTFVLQHSGLMDRGTPQLVVTVVPDSGTGQLTGLTGRMMIRVEAGGKHFYDFEYTLP